jgi:hypothetical protein
LYATDGDERIGVGSDCIGDDIFELAQLVAAERKAGIAVLALGIDLGLAAEMAAEPRQLFNMRRPKGKRIACEFFQHREFRDPMAGTIIVRMDRSPEPQA